ncbi:MAG: ubiquinol-cytochrome c reductase iron-sulfur subunit [Planctomycetaceae bacterium]
MTMPPERPDSNSPRDPDPSAEREGDATAPPHANDDPSRDDVNRRGALAAMMALGGAVWGGIVGVPALLAALTPALKPRRGPVWRDVGRLDDFTIGAVEPAVFRVGRRDWAKSLAEKSVYVWRRSADDRDDVVVFSRNCTDLSCPVKFDPGSECFFCPCHGGIFAKDGTPLAGPPPRPLYRYDTRIRGGMLELDVNSLPPMT